MPSTIKFNPTYKIDIQQPPVLQSIDLIGIPPDPADQKYLPSDKFTEIAFPLTIDFSIKRSVSASLNSAEFSIYNLSAKTRALLAKDRYNQNDLGNGKERRTVIFSAGYSNQNQVMFQGNLMEAWSERRGTEIITHLNCQDGGYDAYNKYTNVTLNPPTSLRDILTTLAQSIGLNIGHASTPEGNDPLRPISLSGNAFELIQDNFGVNETFIDNQQLFFLKTNEYLPGTALLISNDTGLQGVPKRQDSIIEVSMIMEPGVRLGQLVKLESVEDPRFNGYYKVLGIEHNGTISGAISGSRITKLQLLIGSGALGDLVPAS